MANPRASRPKRSPISTTSRTSARASQTHGTNHGPPPRRAGSRRKAATLKLARRVEALGRVLANPAPHIRRAARFLARLPQGVLLPPDPPPRWWMQGVDDIFAPQPRSWPPRSMR